MSFALYGPIASFTKTYTDYNGTAVKLVGDKVLLYLQGLNEWSMYTLTFTKISTLKNTTDFSRIYNLTLHRLNKSPEVYTGYGDGVSPRCPKPYGTCAAEMERYTYDSSSTEMICPNENCDEGNVTLTYFDAKTSKIVTSTSESGNKIYIIDPDTKTFKKIVARNAGWHTHFNVAVLPYNDTYVYIQIVPYEPGTDYPSTGSLYRIKLDDLINLSAGSVIEDYAEKIADLNAKIIEERKTFTNEFMGGWGLTKWVSWTSPRGLYTVKPDGTFFDHNLSGDVLRFFGTKYALISKYPGIDIYDLSTNSVVGTISQPYSGGWEAYHEDAPFIAFNDASKIYIYLIKYKDVAPVIQYDHVNRKFRVVDYITGSVVNATVSVYKSRLCTPSHITPLAITPTTISVSDWTPIPSALKTECITISIKDIVG